MVHDQGGTKMTVEGLHEKRAKRERGDKLTPKPGVDDGDVMLNGGEEDVEGVKVYQVTQDKGDDVDPDDVKVTLRDEGVAIQSVVLVIMNGDRGVGIHHQVGG